MEDTLNSIVEERVGLMVSSDGKTLERRTAHFIKPSLAIDSIDGSPIATLPNHCLSSLSTTFDPKKWSSQVNFFGWRYPQKDWKTWVDNMASLHQSTWKNAGVFEAITNSTYKIEKNNDLVFAVAQKWCHETNSFIFPWGEATISLEDMMILGGYSVLGSPVFTPIETKEMKETLVKLNEARKELNKCASKKPSHRSWMKKFMDSCSEIEHEAFLALWLSRFVLPSSFDVVNNSVFPIAVHLASGNRIALGPAVLARIYRDLSCLKQKIVASTPLDSNCGDEIVALRSPFTLVQAWVWERFLDLRPKPTSIVNGQPRLALWHDLKFNVQDVRVRSVIDSAKERFEWRPYVNGAKFYSDTEIWVRVDSQLDDELLSFARCLRASELVGLDCIEQYLPHRVSLQFGLDQDVPGSVPRSNGSPEIAWSDYNNTGGRGKLYIPSRIFEADVTAGYSSWWKQSMLNLSLQEESKTVFTSSKMVPESSKLMEKGYTYSGCKTVPQNLNRSGSLLKRNDKGGNASSDHGSLKRLKQLAEHPNLNKELYNARFVARSSSLPREYPRKGSNSPAFGSEVNIESKNGTSSFSSPSKPSKELQPDFEIQKELNNSPFPPGFAPKGNMLQDKSSFNRDKATVASSVPPGFTPKSSITEVTATMGRSARNHYSMEKKTGGNHEMSASHPVSVSSDSDEEDKPTKAEMSKSNSNNKFQKTDSRDALEKKLGAGNEVPRCELITELGAEQAANGASTGAATDSNGERPTNNLEARISRLERLLAEMKAAKEVKSVTKACVILD